jgi:hypothetical protein
MLGHHGVQQCSMRAIEAAWASHRNVLAAALGVAHGEVPRTVLGLMERVGDLGARADCSGMDRIGVTVTT